MRHALTLTASLIAGCAGCAMTPAEVLERGVQVNTDHTGTPAVVAHCMETHVETNKVGMLATTRPQPDGGLQMIVRILGETTDTGAVIRFMPSGGGTRATWYISPNVIIISPESFMNHVRGNC